MRSIVLVGRRSDYWRGRLQLPVCWSGRSKCPTRDRITSLWFTTGPNVDIKIGRYTGLERAAARSVTPNQANNLQTLCPIFSQPLRVNFYGATKPRRPFARKHSDRPVEEMAFSHVDSDKRLEPIGPNFATKWTSKHRWIDCYGPKKKGPVGRLKDPVAHVLLRFTCLSSKLVTTLPIPPPQHEPWLRKTALSESGSRKLMAKSVLSCKHRKRGKGPSLGEHLAAMRKSCNRAPSAPTCVVAPRNRVAYARSGVVAAYTARSTFTPTAIASHLGRLQNDVHLALLVQPRDSFLRDLTTTETTQQS